jgi:hypothetical protein
MAETKNENALVAMHRQTLARGGNVGVNATSFTIEELTQLVRSANGLQYRSKIKIYDSKKLKEREKTRIRSATVEPWRVSFT